MITTLRQQMHQDLQLAGLSERTQEAYLRAVRQLADHFHKAPDRLSEEQLRAYLLYLKNEKRFAPSSLIVAVSGIKFFYTHTAPRDWKTLQKLRVPKPKTLPDVLTIDEVRRLIDAVRTPHNRTYFWTVYSLGLRLQEGLNLQVGDIDGARMLVHVHHGKGAKDRYVPLPGRTLEVLREYWATHRHPEWLFPATGRDGHQAANADRPMTRSSVQKAMSRVVRELGLTKVVSIHTLRHSYATHLLEAGTPIHHVAELLGDTVATVEGTYSHVLRPKHEVVDVVRAILGAT
jgi:integrase/recombinase XerD